MRWPAFVMLAMLAGCRAGGKPAAGVTRFDPGRIPDSLFSGSVLYREYCSSCHGEFGAGDGLGPPLVDTLYLPRRLPDEAVQDAVRNGVKQTYWSYGDMPVIHRASPGDVTRITAYLRWLQRRAGLIAEPGAAR